MRNVKILDCTLRDGGYVNNFEFGEHAIKEIIAKLTKAAIDIIECGWLVSGADDKNCSQYGSISRIKEVLGKKNPKLLYVAMLQYGNIANEEIEPWDKDSIDGIRITFHEHEIEGAFILAKQLMNKGYKVFIQPVGTTSYTDETLLKLIEKTNDLRPYAFYLVDTLGIMYKNDLLRMFYLIDHNLNKNIAFGFHSHNNLQLSFSNAQELLQINTQRMIILDSSVYGMGRGAGNLNTELLTHFINSNIELRYDNLEIFKVLDRFIKPLSVKYKWGYDMTYYIASIHKCHPNYGSFLLNKQTLCGQDIHAILNGLIQEKKSVFDKEYISEEYAKYMDQHVNDAAAIKKIKERIANKPVLLLGPGKSLNTQKDKIKRTIQSNDYFVISINFVPEEFAVNMAFISNMKRLESVVTDKLNGFNDFPMILTSNLKPQESYSNVYVIDYAQYLNEEQCIVDNAGLMCINMLKKIGVEQVKLAGFDGFDTLIKDNYYQSQMYLEVEAERLIEMNKAIKEKLSQVQAQMQISFLTESVYKE